MFVLTGASALVFEALTRLTYEIGAVLIRHRSNIPTTTLKHGVLCYTILSLTNKLEDHRSITPRPILWRLNFLPFSTEFRETRIRSVHAYLKAVFLSLGASPSFCPGEMTVSLNTCRISPIFVLVSSVWGNPFILLVDCCYF